MHCSIPALLLISIWTGGLAAESSATTELTLEQAVERALDTSHRLKAANAGALSAQAGTEEARSARLPRLELQENFLRTTNPVLVFGGLLRQESFTEENFDVERLNRPDALDNFGTQVNLFQPIWAGGEIGSGIDAAESGLEAATADRERTRQEVVHQVIEAYANVVVAEHQRAEAKASRDVVLANKKLVTDLYETGLVVESDLLQVQVRESELTELVIRAENAVAVSKTALNLAMGVEADRHWKLTDLDPERFSEIREDVDELAQSARRNRPDLQAATARAAAAVSATRTEKAGYFPEIGLGGGWEANTEDFAGDHGTNWSVAVRLKWTAFDGFATRSRVRKARQQAALAAEMRELLDQQVSLEVRRAYFDLQGAEERRTQAERSMILAERNLEIVRDRYREGLTAFVELQEAETALTRARARSVLALRDVLVSRATLELATGNL